MFACPEWEQWRVRRCIGDKFRTWEDLGLKVWVDKGKDEGIDRMQVILSKVDLTCVKGFIFILFPFPFSLFPFTYSVIFLYLTFHCAFLELRKKKIQKEPL